MSVFLTEIKIKGYRSCRNVVFTPQPDLSTLIGLNGSGKTNILQGILLLKQIPYIHQNSKVDNTEWNVNHCQLEASISINGKIIQYQAELVNVITEQNDIQIIHADESWNVKTLIDSKEDRWIPGALSLISLFRNLEFSCFDQVPFFKSLKPSQKKLIDTTMGNVLDYINSIEYYSASQFTDPTRCPSTLEIDGANRLINVFADNNRHGNLLYDLYTTKEKRPEQYTQFIALIGKEGLNLVDSINIEIINLSGNVPDKLNTRQLIVPRTTKGNVELYFNQLSEGTFKSLALLFYLITDKSSLLLIEEPEVCVHHGLLNHLIAAIKAFSSQKQIIFSTHSDFVLDSLKPENVFLVKNSDKLGTTVKAIPKALSKQHFLALKGYLATEGNLGDYWRAGGIDGQ